MFNFYEDFEENYAFISKRKKKIKKFKNILIANKLNKKIKLISQSNEGILIHKIRCLNKSYKNRLKKKIQFIKEYV